MHDIQLLELKNKDRFYLIETTLFSPSRPVSFKYLIDYERSLRQSTGIKYDDLLIGATVEAPQVQLAKTVRDRFQTVDLHNWREQCCASLQQILETPKLDDLLRLLLFKRLLEFAVSGDMALAHALAPLSAVLAESDIDLTGRWMDPGDTSARLNRNRVPELLKRIPAEILREATSAAKSWEATLIARLSRRCLVIGWLARAADGTWVLHSDWRPDGRYELSVIHPKMEWDASWMPVGKVTPDGVHLTAAGDQPAVYEGQFVYAHAVDQSSAAAVSNAR
jgi:hypothetical protein